MPLRGARPAEKERLRDCLIFHFSSIRKKARAKFMQPQAFSACLFRINIEEVGNRALAPMVEHAVVARVVEHAALGRAAAKMDLNAAAPGERGSFDLTNGAESFRMGIIKGDEGKKTCKTHSENRWLVRTGGGKRADTDPGAACLKPLL